MVYYKISISRNECRVAPTRPGMNALTDPPLALIYSSATLKVLGQNINERFVTRIATVTPIQSIWASP